MNVTGKLYNVSDLLFIREAIEDLLTELKARKEAKMLGAENITIVEFRLGEELAITISNQDKYTHLLLEDLGVKSACSRCDGRGSFPEMHPEWAGGMHDVTCNSCGGSGVMP